MAPRRSRRKINSETWAAEMRKAIGGRLSLELLQMLDQRVERSRNAEKFLDRELKKDAPNVPKVELLSKVILTNYDVLNFNNSIQDRFGEKRNAPPDPSAWQPLQVTIVVKGEVAQVEAKT